MATGAARLLSVLSGLGESGAATVVRFDDGDAYLVRVVSTLHAEEGGDVVADVLQVISAPAGGGIPAGACMNFYLADVAEVTVAGRRVFPDPEAEPGAAPTRPAAGEFVVRLPEAPLREEAEYLRLALAMGLITPDEVVAWADRQIAALDKPPIQVIDVSLAGSRPPVEIVDLLAAVPGNGDLTAAAHRALGLLLRRFRANGISLEQVAEALRAYSSWASAPEDERLWASNFTDVVYCLRQSYAGRPESIRAEVEQFLERHAAEAPKAEPGAAD